MIGGQPLYDAWGFGGYAYAPPRMYGAEVSLPLVNPRAGARRRSAASALRQPPGGLPSGGFVSGPCADAAIAAPAGPLLCPASAEGTACAV